VSTPFLLVLSILLILAGAVSIAAATMGNPIKIGRSRFPGPETSVERAVIGVIGAVCLAAIIPAFIVSAAHGAPVADNIPFTPDSPTPTPELVVTATAPVPTSSTPEPAAGPSTAVPTPGKPTVTSIAVAAGTANGCNRGFSASVHVENGPVAVRYRIYVDGVLVGPTARNRTVDGTGPKALDAITVTAAHSGPIKVRYDVTGPNPTLLTGSTTWTAPAACQPTVAAPPPPPVTTQNPPPPTTDPVPPTTVIPSLSVDIAGTTTYNNTCDAVTPPFPVTGSVLIGAGTASSVSVTWVLHVTGGFGANSGGPFAAPVGDRKGLPDQSVSLPDGLQPGDSATITAYFTVSSPDTSPTSVDSSQVTITIHCAST
jgi:hypothetical protein